MSLFANTIAQLYQPSFFTQESPALIYLKQLQCLLEQSQQKNANHQLVLDAYKLQLMCAEYKTLLNALNELEPETRKQFRHAFDFVIGKVGQFLRHRTLKKMLNAFRAMRQLKIKVKKESSTHTKRTRYPVTIPTSIEPTPEVIKHILLAPLNGILSQH